MSRNQITITYPEHQSGQLKDLLSLLKQKHCVNVSAFCRVAIEDRLNRLYPQELSK